MITQASHRGDAPKPVDVIMPPNCLTPAQNRQAADLIGRVGLGLIMNLSEEQQLRLLVEERVSVRIIEAAFAKLRELRRFVDSLHEVADRHLSEAVLPAEPQASPVAERSKSRNGRKVLK
jgi:hypothetical protein